MIKWFYKKIIRRLELYPDQLNELTRKLNPENICAGPFYFRGKMCPNTTALFIKERQLQLDNSADIKALFKKYGISRLSLWVFYVIFDLPSMISNGFFRRSLKKMKEAVTELIV